MRGSLDRSQEPTGKVGNRSAEEPQGQADTEALLRGTFAGKNRSQTSQLLQSRDSRQDDSAVLQDQLHWITCVFCLFVTLYTNTAHGPRVGDHPKQTCTNVVQSQRKSAE